MFRLNDERPIGIHFRKTAGFINHRHCKSERGIIRDGDDLVVDDTDLKWALVLCLDDQWFVGCWAWQGAIREHWLIERYGIRV